MTVDLEQFFAQPISATQRQYEAVRAIIVDKLSAEQEAIKFHYSTNTLHSLVRDVRAGKLQWFPLSKKKGPQQRHTPEHIQVLVVDYRKQGRSCTEVAEKLTEEGYKISARTVEYIVADFQLPRLPRRTQVERGMTCRQELIALKASPLNFDTLVPFQMDCPVAGVFFFLPYIIESGILECVKRCYLPESSAISTTEACLSMLLLKLIGSKRLSHIQAYDHEPCLGLFAGLNQPTWPPILAGPQKPCCSPFKNASSLNSGRVILPFMALNLSTLISILFRILEQNPKWKRSGAGRVAKH